MQPFEPELKEALKRAHPGLTDADIRQVEAALSDRESVARRSRPGDAQRADQRWQEVSRKVPRLQEVMLEFDLQQIAEQRPKPRPPVDIRRKR